MMTFIWCNIQSSKPVTTDVNPTWVSVRQTCQYSLIPLNRLWTAMSVSVCHFNIDNVASILHRRRNKNTMQSIIQTIKRGLSWCRSSETNFTWQMINWNKLSCFILLKVRKLRLARAVHHVCLYSAVPFSRRQFSPKYSQQTHHSSPVWINHNRNMHYLMKQGCLVISLLSDLFRLPHMSMLIHPKIQ